MQEHHRHEHVWNALVWPIVWPWLIIQLVLVLACMGVILVAYWSAPGNERLAIVLTASVALVIGSCLNVGGFMLLIRSRLRRHEQGLDHAMKQFESELDTPSSQASQAFPSQSGMSLQPQEGDRQDPAQRLSHLRTRLGRKGAAEDPAAPDPWKCRQCEGVELDVLLAERDQEIARLRTGRQHAREESRLKSDYLQMLERETSKLLSSLPARASVKDAENAEQVSETVRLRERLADIRTLLANLSDESLPASSPAASSSPSSPRTLIRRVLVVDDGPVNLMIARQVLEREGILVDAASSGAQALERQASTFYDLVFMDIFMPEIDGFETARRWRQAETLGDARRAVLVALTANAERAAPETCREAGMDDLLSKPYRPDALLACVFRWLPEPRRDLPS